MNLIKLTGIFLFFFAMSVQGQIVHEKGSPASWNMKSTQKVASFRLPAMDNDKLRVESNVMALEKPGPIQFAQPVKTDLRPSNSGTWSDISANERVWRIQLESPGALSLNVIFSEYRLKKGESVFLYNADKTQVLGPFTHLNNKSWGSLSTTLIRDHRITVEFRTQKNSNVSGRFTIGQVAHGFRNFGDSGACNNNVICEGWEDWTCQTNSVVLLMSEGRGFCTGTLLNNTSGDGTPIISTANHCVNGSVDNWSFIFNWKSPVCSPTQNASMDQSVSGATMRAQDGASDFALVEMSEKPPAEYDAFYSGWDATGDVPDFVVGIHHPSGDIMKISKDNDSPRRSGNYWAVDWDDGTTEPGSSGSVLYNQEYRMVGQLYGGQASCSNLGGGDDYGRLDVSWGLGASQVLDPGGTGTKIVDGMGSAACGGTAASARFTVDNTSCSGAFSFTDASNNATSWNWDFGDGTTSTEQNPQHTFTVPGEHEVTLAITGTEGDNSTATETVTVSPVAALNTYQNCSAPATTLNATAPAGVILDWYNAPTGGVVLHSGHTFVTAAVAAPTTFYVEAREAVSESKVGPVDNSFGEGQMFSQNTDHGLNFEVFSSTVIKSVKMYAGSRGDRKIEVQKTGSNDVQTKTVNLNQGEQRVELNFSVDPGEYLIKIADGSEVDLFRNANGPNFPYLLSDVISITGSTANGRYYYFYDWEVQGQGCSAGRVPLVAVPAAQCTSTPVDEQVTQSGLKVQLMSAGNGIKIFSPVDVSLEIQTVQGRSVFSSHVVQGENQITFPVPLQGLYVLSFPGSNFPAKLVFMD